MTHLPLRFFRWFVFATVLLAPVGAHADEGVDAFGDAGAAWESWTLAGGVVFVAIRILKDPRVLDFLGARLPKPWGPAVAAAFLGALATGIDAVTGQRMPWQTALAQGGFTLAVAVLLHVFGIDVLRSGREVAWPKPEAPPPPPNGRNDVQLFQAIHGDDGGTYEPLPPVKRIMFAFVLLAPFAFTGCPGCDSAIHTGAAVANYTAETINGAEPVLTRRCTEKVAAVKTEAELDALEATCSPAWGAWEGARVAHVGLTAALQAAAAGNMAGLPAAISEATTAGAKLAEAMGAFK